MPFELTDCTVLDFRTFFLGLPTDRLSVGSNCDGMEVILFETLWLFPPMKTGQKCNKQICYIEKEGL